MSLAKSFLLGLAQSAPGAFVIPTTARISRNELADISKSNAEGGAQYAGFVTSALVEFAGAIYCLNHHYNDVFGAFAITNLSSGAYELGRAAWDRGRNAVWNIRINRLTGRSRDQYQPPQGE